MSKPPDSEARAARKAGVTLLVGDAAAGTRLDQWLAAELAPALSRNRIQALIRDGAVRCDGVAVSEAKRKVAAGERYGIAVPEPAPAAPQAEAIPLDILFEDDSLIVVNKPPGMVVHPGAGVASGTLVNALLHHCADTLSGIGGVKRPGIVHRLDRDTSGVLVAAKTDAAHRALSEAFADHGRSGSLERTYLALVWGAPARTAGRIDAHLGRSTRNRILRAVVPPERPDARNAVTHYKVARRYGTGASPDTAALLKCRLETGRTHQIRVHMAHIGHPLIGDPDYAGSMKTKTNRLPEPLAAGVLAFRRQALHARTLSFAHPASGALLSFSAPPPPDMADLIAAFEALA